MKRLLTIICIFFVMSMSVEAKPLPKNFNSIINQSGINESTISISIKDVNNAKNIYQLNDKIMVSPASVQKILTLLPIIDVLGENYNFTTSVYQKNSNEYIIKLGADPYLKSSDLEILTDKINKETVKKVYIDDYIIERKEWGEGWQWDDDLNPSILRFNSYNLDSNIAKITIMPTTSGVKPQIINQNKYPFVFFNNAITGKENNITVSRDNALAPNVIKIDGTINTPEVKIIPINNLKRYFDYKLIKALENKKIYLKEALNRGRVNKDDKLLTQVCHPISIAIDDVLLNSNNMVIETLFKLAGGNFYNKQGTDSDGLQLFHEYCNKMQLDCSGIKLVDASGVSKNNLVSADFVTNFLIKNKNSNILDKMATPGQGTLRNRMLPLQNNLKAKTGTLSNISSIAGFITAKSGTKYAFCIIINTPSPSEADKKILEDYLIREVYLKL